MAPLSPGGPAVAHVGATMHAELALLHAEFPTLTRLSVVGETTYRQPIVMLEITNFEDVDGTETPLYVDGTMHGNEMIGGEVTYWTARKMLFGHGTDARATRLVEDAHTYIIPVVNADGNLYGHRKNANGVDLNRNFPWHWCEQPGASTNPYSQTYCGPSAGSESETQTVMRVVNAVKPQIVVSMHSGTEELLYPWGYTTAPAPDFAMFQRLGQKFQAVTNMPASHALYPVTGATRDWVYGNHGVPAFTFEVHDYQATSAVVVNGQSYETYVARAIEGTLWLLDNAGRMRAVVGEPTASVVPGGEARFALANVGWGDATVAWSIEVVDAPLASGASGTLVVPAESAATLAWLPEPTGDGQGRVVLTGTYAPRKHVSEPATFEATYLATVENGALTGLVQVDT